MTTITIIITTMTTTTTMIMTIIADMTGNKTNGNMLTWVEVRKGKEKLLVTIRETNNNNNKIKMIGLKD
jgi:hypothetical protein